MKIRYKRIIRSSNVEPSILIKNIIAELDRPGYTIKDQTQSRVEFKYNNIWRFGSRTEVFRNVDGGVFDIISESQTIVFSYYLSPLFEILATYLKLLSNQLKSSTFRRFPVPKARCESIGLCYFI